MDIYKLIIKVDFFNYDDRNGVIDSVVLSKLLKSETVIKTYGLVLLVSLFIH